MLIDVDVNEEVPRMYSVSAMPTLVIADADGAELAKSVGAPFNDAKGAIAWFDGIGGKIDQFAALKVKWDESKHTNSEVGNQFIDAAVELGKTNVALEVLKSLINAAGEDKQKAGALHTRAAKLLIDNYEIDAALFHAEAADELLPAEGDARIDTDIVRAKILLWCDDIPRARKLCEKHYDNLLKASDARVVDLAETYLSTTASMDQAVIGKRGREMYLKLAEVFSKHERIWEIKVRAAWHGLSCGQEEPAEKELKEVAEKGEGEWKDIAKSILEERAKEKEEEPDSSGE